MAFKREEQKKCLGKVGALICATVSIGTKEMKML